MPNYAAFAELCRFCRIVLILSNYAIFVEFYRIWPNFAEFCLIQIKYLTRARRYHCPNLIQIVYASFA